MADFAYLVQMDIADDWEDEFNRVYDTEHAKYICNAAGVVSCTRYRLESTDAKQVARYAALYEMDDPGVPQSDGWQAEAEKGDWITKIRPHASNRTHTVLRRIAAEVGGPPATADYVLNGADRHTGGGQGRVQPPLRRGASARFEKGARRPQRLPVSPGDNQRRRVSAIHGGLRN